MGYSPKTIEHERDDAAAQEFRNQTWSRIKKGRKTHASCVLSTKARQPLLLSSMRGIGMIVLLRSLP